MSRTTHKEIPEGYKQTSLGIIPKDWSVKKLNRLGEFHRGKGLPKRDLVDKGLNAIRYGEIYTVHHYYLKEFYSFITKEIAQTSFKIEKGDILFAGSGETVEEIGKSVAYLGNEEAYAGGDIVILRTDNNSLNTMFMGFVTNSDIFKRQTYSLGQGNSVVHIYPSNLKNTKLPIPPLPEQEQIASCLTTWDKGIEKLSTLIEAKKQQKKGLMQGFFNGQLTVAMPEALEGGAIIQAKEGEDFRGNWKELRLIDVGLINTGNTPSKENEKYWGNDFCWTTAEDMNDKYVFKTAQRLSEEGIKHARIAEPDSILVTCIASIGKNAITKVRTGFNQQINSIYVNSNHNNEFIYYLIDYKPEKLISYAGAGALLMLNKKTFSNIKYNLPPLEEQNAIADVLIVADNEIALLEQKMKKIQLQKKGLMQVLLTGQKRLMEND